VADYYYSSRIMVCRRFWRRLVVFGRRVHVERPVGCWDGESEEKISMYSKYGHPPYKATAPRTNNNISQEAIHLTSQNPSLTRTQPQTTPDTRSPPRPHPQTPPPIHSSRSAKKRSPSCSAAAAPRGKTHSCALALARRETRCASAQSPLRRD
jgi:hypothetical protein